MNNIIINTRNKDNFGTTLGQLGAYLVVPDNQWLSLEQPLNILINKHLSAWLSRLSRLSQIHRGRP